MKIKLDAYEMYVKRATDSEIIFRNFLTYLEGNATSHNHRRFEFDDEKGDEIIKMLGNLHIKYDLLSENELVNDPFETLLRTARENTIIPELGVTQELPHLMVNGLTAAARKANGKRREPTQDEMMDIWDSVDAILTSNRKRMAEEYRLAKNRYIKEIDENDKRKKKEEEKEEVVSTYYILQDLEKSVNWGTGPVKLLKEDIITLPDSIGKELVNAGVAKKLEGKK